MIADSTVARATAWPWWTLRTLAPRVRRRVVTVSFLVWGLLGCLLVIGAWSAPSPSDDRAPVRSETSVKAAFLYRFLAFVEWPERAFASAKSPIVIGVLGADALADELDEVVADRVVGERAVEVRRVERAHALDGVNVLYVAERAAAALPDLAPAAARSSVLLVSDFDHGLDEGSVINLLVVDHRVRFEVSLAAAARSALRLSSRLLGVAYRVRAQ